MKVLKLEGNQIGDRGAEKLAEALPKLVNLTETWLDSLLCTEQWGYIVLHTIAHYYTSVGIEQVQVS